MRPLAPLSLCLCTCLTIWGDHFCKFLYCSFLQVIVPHTGQMSPGSTWKRSDTCIYSAPSLPCRRLLFVLVHSQLVVVETGFLTGFMFLSSFSGTTVWFWLMKWAWARRFRQYRSCRTSSISTSSMALSWWWCPCRLWPRGRENLKCGHPRSTWWFTSETSWAGTWCVIRKGCGAG